MSAHTARAQGEQAVVDALRQRIEPRGSSKRVSHELGVTPSILCRTAKGKIPVSDRIAEGLGFRRVSHWERIIREEELALADKIEAELNSPPLLKEWE